jgi:hypothetical protein
MQSFGLLRKDVERTVYRGETISRLLRPTSGEVMLMTYNFPETAWDEDSPLGKKLMEWYGNGIRIRVVGGPSINAKEYVSELVKIQVIDVRILPKPQTRHVCIATNPQQLFIEKKHTIGLAKNCYYTDKPYPEVYGKFIGFFEKLWEEGLEI